MSFCVARVALCDIFNLFDNVSKLSKLEEVCVAGVALCDIPTCLITCRRCQNWRKSRPKCSFWSSLVSRLESLHGFPVASPCLWGSSALHTLHFTLHNLHFRLHTPHFNTPHFTLCTLQLLTPHSRLYTPHSTLYTPHSSLYTLHSTL